MELWIITGLSGAGKTQALDILEDLGYFAMDNVPPALLMKFVELSLEAKGLSKVAAVVDLRSGPFFKELRDTLRNLRALQIPVKLLFLDATEEVIVSRYKERRRPHPLADSITEGVAKERSLLEEMRINADVIIDTSFMSPSELRGRIEETMGEKEMTALRWNIVSFGFKHGILKDADLVMDVRFLPNPYYIEELKHTNGLCEETSDYVLRWPQSREFLSRMMDMIDFLSPYYYAEGKRQLVLGIGCTGGCHRSVAIAEELGRQCRERGHAVTVRHREIGAKS